MLSWARSWNSRLGDGLGRVPPLEVSRLLERRFLSSGSRKLHLGSSRRVEDLLESVGGIGNGVGQGNDGVGLNVGAPGADAQESLLGDLDDVERDGEDVSISIITRVDLDALFGEKNEMLIFLSLADQNLATIHDSVVDGGDNFGVERGEEVINSVAGSGEVNSVCS